MLAFDYQPLKTYSLKLKTTNRPVGHDCPVRARTPVGHDRPLLARTYFPVLQLK